MDVGITNKGGQSNLNNIGVKGDTVRIQQIGNAGTLNNSDTKDMPAEAQVRKAIDKLNGFLKSDNTEIQYQYHSVFKNDLMIKIIDKDTNQVVLEVPPKQILDLVAKMVEMVGILFDKKA